MTRALTKRVSERRHLLNRREFALLDYLPTDRDGTHGPLFGAIEIDFEEIAPY